MLIERIRTAIILLLVLAAVFGSGSLLAFQLTLSLFFAAACWESLRLFNVRRALPLATLGAALLLLMLLKPAGDGSLLAGLCVLIWLVRFVPALKFGLPPTEGARGILFITVYLLALLGCFLSIAVLFQRSVLYLVSIMAIVWVADIGAYFAGKAFGKRKLAPHISPGKSWEGAIGGWLAVVIIAAATSEMAVFSMAFPAQLLRHTGWPLWVLLMTLLVAASIIGDLFESLMKRRAGFKDSSHLLPGHGGVLDRIDALIPVMPLALLLGARL